LESCKEDNVTEESIEQKLVLLERDKPLAKTLFDKTCERWRGLLYALHRDDGEQLLKMLVDICYSLDEKASKMLIESFRIFHFCSFSFLSCIAESKDDK
jgi:hypothetical protein